MVRETVLVEEPHAGVSFAVVPDDTEVLHVVEDRRRLAVGVMDAALRIGADVGEVPLVHDRRASTFSTARLFAFLVLTALFIQQSLPEALDFALAEVGLLREDRVDVGLNSHVHALLEKLLDELFNLFLRGLLGEFRREVFRPLELVPFQNYLRLRIGFLYLFFGAFEQVATVQVKEDTLVEPPSAQRLFEEDKLVLTLARIVVAKPRPVVVLAVDAVDRHRARPTF